MTKFSPIDLSPVLREEMSRGGLRRARELAELLNITRAYASQLLNGRLVGYRKAAEFASTLGISLAKFAKETFFVPIIGGWINNRRGTACRAPSPAVKFLLK